MHCAHHPQSASVLRAPSRPQLSRHRSERLITGMAASQQRFLLSSVLSSSVHLTQTESSHLGCSPTLWACDLTGQRPRDRRRRITGTRRGSSCCRDVCTASTCPATPRYSSTTSAPRGMAATPPPSSGSSGSAPLCCYSWVSTPASTAALASRMVCPQHMGCCSFTSSACMQTGLRTHP